ncbi:MAG: hypothetical protein HRT87_05250 [Legionellales bacterium]|nr:hypothetical protein [Legionellales bacterium]
MASVSTFIILVFALMFPLEAMAYIDPASGSTLLSVIFGFFVAASLTIKKYWYKFKSLFKRSKNAQKNRETS